jgi:ArsR family transcriptional regulator, arsenate/arsenite/antimonite-responsive transcriptional repressor
MDMRILRLMNILPVTLYPALAQETRLRCLLLLLAHDELCVCELTYVIGAAQPTISRHLAHLVVDRREGLWIHYRINPGLPAWVLQVLRETAPGSARHGAVLGCSQYIEKYAKSP